MSPAPKRFQQSRQLHFITFSCYRREAKLSIIGAAKIFERALEQVRQWYGFSIYGSESVEQQQRNLGRFVRLTLPLVLIATCALPISASTPPDVVPDCLASELDANYDFINNPPTEQVVVTFRNISQRSCALRPGAGVMFGAYRHGHNIWTKDCRNCGPDGKFKNVFKNVNPTMLGVGESAHLVISWETKVVGGGTSCQEGGQLNSYVNSDLKHGYDIWAGVLLGDVCSVVRVDSYLPGAFNPQSDRVASDREQGEAPVRVKLTPSSGTVYSNDSFWLHVDVEDRNEALSVNERSCPILFLRTRASDGTTRFSEIDGKCRITPIGQGLGRLIQADMSTIGWGALMEPGERSVEVLVLSGSPQAPRVEMIRSNELSLRIVDPATIPRTWGPEVKGLAVSLAVDKDTYELGEDVPLRLAVENFSAGSYIAGGEPPCVGLAVQLRDSQGHTRESSEITCFDHGWEVRYPKGNVVPLLGLTLRAFGFLPKEAGTYTLTASWNARTVGEQEQTVDRLSPAASRRPLVPYAVVQSAPVTFKIIEARGAPFRSSVN